MINNDVIKNSNLPEKTLERISGGSGGDSEELIFQDTVKTHVRPVIMGTKNEGGGNDDIDREDI